MVHEKKKHTQTQNKEEWIGKQKGNRPDDRLVENVLN